MQFHVASCILISDSLFVPQNLSVGKNFALPVKVNFTGKPVKQFYQFFTGKLPVKSPPYCRILSPYYPGSVPLAGMHPSARTALFAVNQRCGRGRPGHLASPSVHLLLFAASICSRSVLESSPLSAVGRQEKRFVFILHYNKKLYLSAPLSNCGEHKWYI